MRLRRLLTLTALVVVGVALTFTLLVLAAVLIIQDRPLHAIAAALVALGVMHFTDVFAARLRRDGG